MATFDIPKRTARRASAWAAVAALAACSGSARAAEPGPDALPVNVIAIQTQDADDQAEALTKALRTAVRALPGWSLGEGDYSLEVLTLSLKCSEPPDAACQTRIADQIKSDRYIWGTLAKKKGANIVVGDVHLWVRGKGTSSFPLEYTANLTEGNEDALKKIATDAIVQVTGGPPKGSVHIKTDNVSGQVLVDGQPVGALQGGEGTFAVPAGPHKITIRVAGFSDTESSVVVKASGGPAELNLPLVPSDDRSPTNWKRIGGIGALGVGVALGIVGLVSSLQVNGLVGDPNYDRYRREHPQTPDVCVAAANPMTGDPYIDDLCTKGKRFQTLQIVSYPLAAVAGGLGIYLLATSGKSEPKTSGFTVNPQVGPHAAKLDVSFAW